MTFYTTKIRLYPTKTQIELLEKHFGCVRFIYNHFLYLRNIEYKTNKKHIHYNECSKILTELKKDHIWLNEVNSQCLQQAIKNLDSAYKAFWDKRSKFPKFKKKYEYQSCRFPQNSKLIKNKLKVIKFKEGIRFRNDLPLNITNINSVTITKNRQGQYFASILYSKDIQKLPPNQNEIGVDLGLTHYLIDSNGIKYDNPRWYKRNLKKLKFKQRQLSRKKKDSKRKEKTRKSLSNIYLKIKNMRSDFQQKLSTKLIRENQTICLEDLAVKNMMKNRILAKSIQDASWSSFVTMLKYKAEWYGREIILIDRFYPSSKSCSSCHRINQNLKLSDRTWKCDCGIKHDRDINAARNILSSGLGMRLDVKQKVRESSELSEAMN